MKQDKIKVCHFVCGLKSGGAEQVIYNYCSRMKHNYEFHIVYQHEPDKKNIDEFTQLGFKFFRIPAKKSKPLKNIWYTYKYIKNNKFQVIHAHMNLNNFIPLICAWICGVKIRISHIHTSDVRKKSVFVLIYEQVAKMLSRVFSNYWIACGKEAGKYMYGKRKFIVINNAIDYDRFKYNYKVREKIRKKHNISVNEKVIGHVGRFTEAKNHMFLLDFFSKIHELDVSYKLFLVGDGELREVIEKRIKDLHLEKSIILTGGVSNTNEYYQAMDLFVLPSKWEGLPLVAIEAQASGLKSLFSVNISDEILITPNTFKLDINVEEWVDCITSLNLNYDRNQVKFNNDYDIKYQVERLEKIYGG